jgi:type I restriction enzyme S subunit
MSDWKTYRLGDFAEINPKISLKQGQEYSFVEMKDLDATFKYVSPSTNKELKGGSKFQNGDTIFARITPCLENGKICQVKNLNNNLGFGSTEFLVFRGRKNVSDSDFVYYLSRSEFVKNNAIQLMTGSSGRQRVEKSSLEELEIIVPKDINTQTQIAQILTSLDDKIELNLQMNQTLEAMAQAIFKEWFVDFKFPGFDGVLVDGLPKGWSREKLENKIVVKNGYAFKGTDFIENGIPVIKIKNVKPNRITLNSLSYVSDEVAQKAEKFIIKRNSLLITMSGNRIDGTPDTWVGKVALFQENGKYLLNQRVSVLELKSEKYLYYFTLLLSSEDFQNYFITNATSSGGQANISPTLIYNTEIVIPAENTLNTFTSSVKYLFEKIQENNNQIQTLTQTRDSLLPRLMSGKIEVKE